MLFGAGAQVNVGGARPPPASRAVVIQPSSNSNESVTFRCYPRKGDARSPSRLTDRTLTPAAASRRRRTGQEDGNEQPTEDPVSPLKTLTTSVCSRLFRKENPVRNARTHMAVLAGLALLLTGAGAAAALEASHPEPRVPHPQPPSHIPITTNPGPPVSYTPSPPVNPNVTFSPPPPWGSGTGTVTVYFLGISIGTLQHLPLGLITPNEAQ